MTDVERLTREYREARARYLSALAEEQQGIATRRRLPSDLLKKLRAARRIASIELADALAGPA